VDSIDADVGEHGVEVTDTEFPDTPFSQLKRCDAQSSALGPMLRLSCSEWRRCDFAAAVQFLNGPLELRDHSL
jgi:hypothetical protein